MVLVFRHGLRVAATVLEACVELVTGVCSIEVAVCVALDAVVEEAGAEFIARYIVATVVFKTREVPFADVFLLFFIETVHIFVRAIGEQACLVLFVSLRVCTERLCAVVVRSQVFLNTKAQLRDTCIVARLVLEACDLTLAGGIVANFKCAVLADFAVTPFFCKADVER